jgi:hypothetical protein
LTLGGTQFLAIVAFLGFLGVAGLFVFSPQVYNLTCSHFEMPEYEKQFGFRLGRIRVLSERGTPYDITAIAEVQPGGVLARAGVRPGDVPKVHHGIAEMCDALGAASQGSTGRLRLWRGDAIREGRYEEREVLVRLRPE